MTTEAVACKVESPAPVESSAAAQEAAAPLPPPTDEEMMRWSTALVEPNQIFEVRSIKKILPKPKKGPDAEITSRFFRGKDRLRAIAHALERSGRVDGVYWTLNPLVTVLLSGRKAASDTHVLARRLLLVDCDPNNEGTVSATNAEKEAARVKALTIREYLTAQGWPAPVLADSGNGWHLLYLVELPNHDTARDLVQRVLQGLADQFDDDQVSVDTSVFNASRITKFYGTKACKGADDQASGRVHRFSRVVELPDNFGAEPVPRKLLDAQAALAPEAEAKAASADTPGERPACAYVPATAKVVERARLCVMSDKVKDSYEGTKGHNPLWGTAWTLIDGFGLTYDQALPILREWNAQKAHPPESEFQVDHKLRDAIKKFPVPSCKLRDAPLPPRPRKRRAATTQVGQPAGAQAGEALPTPGNNGDGASEPLRPKEVIDDPARLARLFIREHHAHRDHDTLAYHNNEWHVWNGAWKPVANDVVRARVTEGIKAELDRENIHAQANPTNGKQIGFVPIVDTRLVSNTLEHLRSLTLLPPDTEQPSWLDGAPLFYPPWNPRDVLPTKTGLVNLRYMAEGMPGASHPPTPAFFESHALSYGFDPNAPEPVNWLTFLGARKPAPGCRINPLWPNDPESIATLQEWIGYLLTTDTSYQKIMMLIGPARCGKGTIAEVIRLLIGPESVANPTLKALTTEFGLQPLIGKPVAIITDARITSHYHMDTQAAIERLLSISGGDAQTINRKNKPHWSGRLPTRFMVMANAFPYFPDASGAIASRMILLQLKRSWLGEENRELLEALTDELPGILRWALNGAQRLRAHGRFSQPESARAALKEFGHATSSINAFLAECAVVHPEARVRRDDLFAAWKEWCTEQGIEKPGTQEQLGRNLRAALPELETTQPSVDGARVRFYVGLELR